MAPTRWRRLGIPLLGFLGVLALLTPRDIPLDCPAGKECGDLLTLTRPSPDPALLHYFVPAAIVGVVVLVLIATRQLPRRPRIGLWIAVGMVVVAMFLAMVLPWGTVPDPLYCGGSFLGRGLGPNECLTMGGHADPRMVLRYLILLGGLVSAAVVMIDSMQRSRVLNGG